MAKRATLTTEAGAPVIDNQQAQSVGASGPVLLQDHYLIEKLARFNRERIGWCTRWAPALMAISRSPALTCRSGPR